MDLTQNKYSWTLVHFEDNYEEGLSKSNFEKKVEDEQNNLRLKLDCNLSKYELISVYLKNNKKVINAIIYNNQFLVPHLRYVALGGITRDRCSDYGIFINPTIYKEFKFEISDIICFEAQGNFIETITKSERKYFFDLFKTFDIVSKKDIETRVIEYSKLPTKKIKLAK